MTAKADAMTVYAIGDLHGQRAKLEDLLAAIDRDGGKNARVVFLGDLVDRGPDSRGVIDTILSGQSAGRDWRVIRGNHDKMFRLFLEEGEEHDDRILSGIGWLDDRVGGRATMASYGVDTHGRSAADVRADLIAAVPQAHLDFLRALVPAVHEDGRFFTHAGIRPGVPLAAQDPADLMWIREPFLSDPRPHPALIVHGHTALDTACHYGNRVNLDSGAGYGRLPSAAAFDGDEVFVVTPRGRERLAPV